MHDKLRWVVMALLLVSSLFISMHSIQGMDIRVSIDRETHGQVELPVIMYHSILKDSSRHGSYVLSPTQLESDLQYLKENGYTAISVSELIAYTSDPFASLPEKPVLLTFDDGFFNNYTYAYPLLQQYDMKAVFSIIGVHTDNAGDALELNPAYDHLSWPYIKEMYLSGRVEFANHSYDLHTIDSNRIASTRKRGESLGNYKQIFCRDALALEKLFEENLGSRSTIYAHPYGLITNESMDFIEDMGYLASFTCTEGINTISKGGSLLGLCRYNRPSGISSQRFFARVLS